MNTKSAFITITGKPNEMCIRDRYVQRAVVKLNKSYAYSFLFNLFLLFKITVDFISSFFQYFV